MQKLEKIRRWKHLHSRWFRSVIGGVAILAGLLPYLFDTYLPSPFNPENNVWVFLVYLLFLVLGNLFYNYFLADDSDRWGKQPDLEALVYFVHSLLMKEADNEPKTELRVCLHRRYGDDQYQRITSYSSGARVSFQSERMTVKSGIVGKIFHEDKPGLEVERVKEGRDRVDILRTEMNFTDDEIKGLWPDSKCWCGVGIGAEESSPTEKNVKFVLYLDSNDPNFFGNRKNDKRRRRLEELAVVIYSYLTHARILE